MKNLIISVVFVCTHIGTVDGQTPATPVKSASATQMKIFEPWQGHWKGAGTMNRNGQQQTFQIDEHITMKLDGTILTVEGIGKDTQGADARIIHHAFGVLNFDEAGKDYSFRSYLADGKSTTAWFDVIDDSNFQWGFDVPSGKVKYSIAIDSKAGTWDEIGEYSGDGNQWFQFLKMHLTRVE